MAEPNKLPLPNTTASAFQAIGSKCQNIGLYFDRYLRFVAGVDWKIDTYEIPRPPRRPDQRSAKLWNLKQIVKAQTELNQHWSNSIVQKATLRWLEMVNSQDATFFKMTPEWRFVVGLGDKTALEVGFTFHRIYGYPLIQGSALKGLARAIALSQIADTLGVQRLSLSEVKKCAKHKPKPLPTPFEKLDDWLMTNDERITDQKQRRSAQEAEEKAWQALRQEGELAPLDSSLLTTFRRIFGTTYAAGEVIFFDAVPAEAPVLEVDVMNVHYPDYYGDKDKPPADNQNPNPIPFLAVGQSPFWFAVGWRGKVNKEGLDQAVKWLKAGLADFGVGAKTAAGYGYFYSAEETN